MCLFQSWSSNTGVMVSAFSQDRHLCEAHMVYYTDSLNLYIEVETDVTAASQLAAILVSIHFGVVTVCTYLKPISNSRHVRQGCTHTNNLKTMSRVILPTARTWTFSTRRFSIAFTSCITKLDFLDKPRCIGISCCIWICIRLNSLAIWQS